MACLKLQPAAVKVGVDFLLTLKKRYNIISLASQETPVAGVWLSLARALP